MFMFNDNTTTAKHEFGCSQWQGDLVHIENHGCFFIHPLEKSLYNLTDESTEPHPLPLRIENLIADKNLFGEPMSFPVDTEDEDYAPELFGLNEWNGKLYCFVYTIAEGTNLIEIDPNTRKARTVVSKPEYDYTWESRIMVVDGVCYTATDTELVSIDLTTGEMKTMSLPDMRTRPVPSEWEKYMIIDTGREEWNYGVKYIGFFTDGDYGYISLYHAPDCTLRFSLLDPADFSYMPEGCPSAAIHFGPEPNLMIPRAIDGIQTKDFIAILSNDGIYRIPSEYASVETSSFDQFMFSWKNARDNHNRFREENITWRNYINGI